MGHSVLIVGFIERGTTDDPEGSTDWLIVRDNQQNTARNVIIPYQNMASQIYPGWDNLLALLYININYGSYKQVSQSEPEPEPEPEPIDYKIDSVEGYVIIENNPEPIISDRGRFLSLIHI